MRKLLLSAVALLALSAQNAFAINLTFQFDVNSSGPSIYACNAGIKHGNTGPNVCFDRVAKVDCTAGCAAGNMNACTGGATPKNCSCTGEFDPSGVQGTYRMDFLQANTADWTDNQVTATGSEPHILTADAVLTGQRFNQIFGTDPGPSDSTQFVSLAAYKKQIKDLTINLGSEIYGAEYFVDICYRGPQIDYRHNDSTVKGLNFGLKAYATIFDIKKADNKSYRELAGLQVKAEARCIMDDEFNYCLADLLPGETSGCGTKTATTHQYYRVSEKGFVDMDGNPANISKLITDAQMAWSGNKTPRFCQVRYSFKETNISKMRKWKLQQARICTYTEITEPTAE